MYISKGVNYFTNKINQNQSKSIKINQYQSISIITES